MFFFFIPIGHDRAMFGLPWFTISVMLLCTLVQFLATALYLSGGQGSFDPAMAMGFVPGDGFFTLTLLTSAFAHGGWIHLAGNMLFLWLVGGNLEYRWGWRVFATLYLGAALVSALSYGLLHPDSGVTLVGASGAVAGAMGAFLVCLYRAKIRVWYIVFFLIFFFKRGTVRVPAYFALPAWFLFELRDTIWAEAQRAGGGVAHSAHVGGFALGLGLAFWLKHSGQDAQLMHASGADVFDEVDREFREGKANRRVGAAEAERQWPGPPARRSSSRPQPRPQDRYPMPIAGGPHASDAPGPDRHDQPPGVEPGRQCEVDDQGPISVDFGLAEPYGSPPGRDDDDSGSSPKGFGP